MFDFLGETDLGEISHWFTIPGFVLGLLSIWVAVWLARRPRLTFSVQPATVLVRDDYGRKFQMWVKEGKDEEDNYKEIDNLCVFDVCLHLKGKTDVLSHHIEKNNNPSLYFPGVHLYDVRTVNPDKTKFYIPFGIPPKNTSMVFVNIQTLRRNSIAHFQVFGSFYKAEDSKNFEQFKAKLNPGFIADVNVRASGQLEKSKSKQQKKK